MNYRVVAVPGGLLHQDDRGAWLQPMPRGWRPAGGWSAAAARPARPARSGLTPTQQQRVIQHLAEAERLRQRGAYMGRFYERLASEEPAVREATLRRL
jgi:hypothetical protein